MKRTLYIAGGFTLAFLMPFTEYSAERCDHEPHGRRRTGI